MASTVIDSNKIKTLSRLIDRAGNVVITCHLSPDGDALGASLAMAGIMSHLGKAVHVISPDQPPQSISFLPGAKDVVVFSRYEPFARNLLSKADLIFCLDYNELKRIDRVAPYVDAAEAPKVMIDHHLHPADFGQEVVISHPEISSTCALVFKVICALGLFKLIDKDIASCIYTGMMTDTGNFSYNSNDPELYTIIAELIKTGIDKDALYQRACNVHSESALRLNGYALSEKMEIFNEYNAALITITRSELNRFGYRKGDTEGLVNVPLSIPGIIYSAYLRDEDTYVKVSMRSRGNFPVNRICSDHFGGGGHLNAAGGEFYGTMDEAVALFKNMLEENRRLYIDAKK